MINFAIILYRGVSMKKRIYLDKIKKRYVNTLEENTITNYKHNENKSFLEKALLCFKTFGLVLLLLLGPSLFASLFASNLQNLSLLSRVFISLAANLIILGILFWIYRDTLIKDFKNYFNRNITEHMELSFKYWLAGFIVMIISNFIITIITNGGIAANEESVRELIDIAPLYMIFDVAIYAPLTEELIFRKSIRDFISTKWVYILVSGLIFGGLHVISSITSYIELLYLIPYSALGIAFAALYSKSDNIFSSICMHALHNTIAIILYLI